MALPSGEQAYLLLTDALLIDLRVPGCLAVVAVFAGARTRVIRLKLVEIQLR